MPAKAVQRYGAMAQITQDNFAWLARGLQSPPPKRYRIGELARHTGLTRQTLHNYTRWGLIQEAEWTPGGHRLYDEAVFARLSRILGLRKQHTVEEIKMILDGSPQNTGHKPGAAPKQEGVIGHGE